MKIKEVPQDAALLDQHREVTYAVDEQGRYVLAPSAGWDPANLANLQAWQLIAAQMREALKQVQSGQASPLLFHMQHHQMDVALLASYVGLYRWQVRRHLRPGPWKRLPEALRGRYAQLFGLAPEALDDLPKEILLPVALADEEGRT
ncbi:hypothetical protein C2E25_06165 [Geothermobacter hydrogeniphilus]|uniref:Uncharacterized protein n=1 Tax=Geothermobacter hydrogeniphilus TaxID=1969733 RepID=A0A2K2HBD2_9BACT|nr:hypothetical protein [Geothermobacter hydrogeniphilus]PNU20626.1 hypothetical protein C2E25_06165 [Geothermobacter hydrogeniphilus]